MEVTLTTFEAKPTAADASVFDARIVADEDTAETGWSSSLS